MEAGTQGSGQAAGESKPASNTTYAVYQTQSADAIKDGIASELVLLKSGVVAADELAARWQVVDADEELKAAAAPEGAGVYLLAIPERRAKVKHTKLHRKVDERRR